MNVAAAVMVMSDRDRSVTVPIRLGIGNFVRGHMNMSRVVIVACFDQGDGGPVRCMAEVVLRLRHAMQVHGRQQGDAQTDPEVAYKVRQREAPTAPLAVGAMIGNATGEGAALCRKASASEPRIEASRFRARVFKGPPDG